MTLTEHRAGKTERLKEHLEKQESQTISVMNFGYVKEAFWVKNKRDCFNLNSENPAGRILERLSLNKRSCWVHTSGLPPLR